MGTLPNALRDERVATAKRNGIVNADAIATASVAAAIPFHLALALVEGESGGRNIYGHDKGGVFSMPPKADGAAVYVDVTPANFVEFLTRVVGGEMSNGVGPAQITYAGALRSGHRDGGYFRQMATLGLLPWVPVDNIFFALSGILRPLLSKYDGNVKAAGTVYNGGNNPDAAARAYGIALAKRDEKWRTRFGIA